MLHDLLVGGLLLAEVRYPSGRRQGSHCWNLPAGGIEVDLTRGQFGATETVGQPEVVARPAGAPKRAREQYLLLRDSVLEALGPVPGELGTGRHGWLHSEASGPGT